MRQYTNRTPHASGLELSKCKESETGSFETKGLRTSVPCLGFEALLSLHEESTSFDGCKYRMVGTIYIFRQISTIFRAP